MADLESASSPETQAEAAAMGWIGPEKFRGDPGRFVDADEFVERGKVVLPIVKAQKAELEMKYGALLRNQIETKEALDRANRSLESIELENSVRTQKAVEAAKAEVKAQLRQASEAGDHEAVAELTEQMVELNAAPPPEKAPVVEAKAPPVAEVDPVVTAWIADGNQWFNADMEKTQLALGVAAKMRKDGDTRVGVSFLNDVKKRTFKLLGEGERAEQMDKVEGGRNGGGDGEGAGAGGKATYQHLPKDAKDACDTDMKRFVGPGKRYGDEKSYRANWAATYFRS